MNHTPTTVATIQIGIPLSLVDRLRAAHASSGRAERGLSLRKFVALLLEEALDARGAT